jgi:hypothetical protein
MKLMRKLGYGVLCFITSILHLELGPVLSDPEI